MSISGESGLRVSRRQRLPSPPPPTHEHDPRPTNGSLPLHSLCNWVASEIYAPWRYPISFNDARLTGGGRRRVERNEAIFTPRPSSRAPHLDKLIALWIKTVIIRLTSVIRWPFAWKILKRVQITRRRIILSSTREHEKKVSLIVKYLYK